MVTSVMFNVGTIHPNARCKRCTNFVNENACETERCKDVERKHPTFLFREDRQYIATSWQIARNPFHWSLLQSSQFTPSIRPFELIVALHRKSLPWTRNYSLTTRHRSVAWKGWLLQSFFCERVLLFIEFVRTNLYLTYCFVWWDSTNWIYFFA